jgi:SAM-dependent methyltransferase
VLDIGCGSGALSAELLRGGRDVVSQDLSDRMLELCRTHLARRHLDSSGVRAGGVDDIPERDFFDAAIALDVIEHIDDDVGALRRLRDALKPTGTLIVSVPAISRLYGPKDVEVGHYRRYDKATLLDALNRAGFESEMCRYWNLIGVPAVWLSVRRGERLDEGFRYSRSPGKRALNAALRGWLRRVEGPIAPPIGLTLLATATPR